MKYFSTAYVYVVFYGSYLNPTELSNYLNLTPTNMGLKGEKGQYGAILKDTFWEYRLKETNALEELDTSLTKLKEVLEGKEEFIRKYVSEKDIKSKCYVVIKSRNNEDTGVGLNNAFISLLHRLNISLEVIVYPYVSTP